MTIMGAHARRYAWVGALAALALAGTLGGLGFLVAGLYLGLSARLPPPAAALAVGGGLLAAAVPVLMAAGGLLRRAGRARAGAAVRAAGSGGVLADEAIRWAQAHPYAAMGAAVMAGVVVGANPRLCRDLAAVAGVSRR